VVQVCRPINAQGGKGGWGLDNVKGRRGSQLFQQQADKRCGRVAKRKDERFSLTAEGYKRFAFLHVSFGGTFWLCVPQGYATDPILDKLGKAEGIYLLPIIKDNGADEDRQRINALHRVNRNLRQIGKMVGIEINLTTYVAHHTWASLMQSEKCQSAPSVKGLDMTRK